MGHGLWRTVSRSVPTGRGGIYWADHGVTTSLRSVSTPGYFRVVPTGREIAARPGDNFVGGGDSIGVVLAFPPSRLSNANPPRNSVPHLCALLLAQGWETTNLTHGIVFLNSTNHASGRHFGGRGLPVRARRSQQKAGCLLKRPVTLRPQNDPSLHFDQHRRILFTPTKSRSTCKQECNCRGRGDSPATQSFVPERRSENSPG
jgi:hypothetical protein